VKPLVTFPDVMLSTVTYLRPALAARTEAFAEGVTIGTVFPRDGEIPFVMVRQDGQSIAQRIDASATVRVSVWHTSEARALALAGLCQALLLAHPGDDEVRLFSPIGGPFPAADPDNGNPLASFSVAARLRPITL
jgi:hypothetical protein